MVAPPSPFEKLPARRTSPRSRSRSSSSGKSSTRSRSRIGGAKASPSSSSTTAPLRHRARRTTATCSPAPSRTSSPATGACAATTSSAASAGTATACPSRTWRKRRSVSRARPTSASIGVAAFNEQCRSMVQRYVAEWRTTVTRMGRWVDFDNDYKTMDPSFMESVWWVFKQLWDQGRIYKAHRVVPYSWKLTTPLSNLEASEQLPRHPGSGHHRPLSLEGRSRRRRPGRTCSAWTTTPWTLPENLALCVGPDIAYEVVEDASRTIATSSRPSASRRITRAPTSYNVADDAARAASWSARRTSRSFRYFADAAQRVSHPRRRLRVDRRRHRHRSHGAGLRRGRLPHLPARRHRARRSARRRVQFTSRMPELAGPVLQGRRQGHHPAPQRRGEARSTRRRIVHSYPFDYRTDTPLIYRAIDAWYVRSRTSASGWRRRTSPITGCPRQSARTASATGSATRATGTSAATATGARASRSGSPRTART